MGMTCDGPFQDQYLLSRPRENTKDPYKEEIKIPPHPHKRKKLIIFPLEGSIFFLCVYRTHNHIWELNFHTSPFKDYR
jgi:hypothetical protein